MQHFQWNCLQWAGSSIFHGKRVIYLRLRGSGGPGAFKSSWDDSYIFDNNQASSFKHWYPFTQDSSLLLGWEVSAENWRGSIKRHISIGICWLVEFQSQRKNVCSWRIRCYFLTVPTFKSCVQVKLQSQTLIGYSIYLIRSVMDLCWRLFSLSISLTLWHVVTFNTLKLMLPRKGFCFISTKKQSWRFLMWNALGSATFSLSFVHENWWRSRLT